MQLRAEAHERRLYLSELFVFDFATCIMAEISNVECVPLVSSLPALYKYIR